MSTIPEGYKETKVGIIPESWDVMTISSQFDFIKTYSNSRNDLIDEGDIQYLHYGDIHTKYQYHLDFEKKTLPSISIEKIKGTPILVKEGDVFIADASEDYADIGKSVEAQNIGNKKVISGLHTFLLRDKGENFVNGYKGLLFYNENVSKEIKRIATGISVLGISKTNLLKISIPKPSLEEQSKISKIIKIWDQAIQTQESLLFEKENLKKGVIQRLLNGEKRFKGFTNEWKTIKINEVFETTRGDVLAVNKLHQEQTVDYKYPVYSSQTKKNGLLGYYNQYLYENSITWTTDGANAGDVKFRKGKFYCTNVCGVLKNDKGFSNQCIAEILNSVTKKYVSYVGNPKLMNNVMSSIKIRIPMSIKEQEKISDFLRIADKEIELLIQEIQELKSQRMGLLQKLLTGQIRVTGGKV